MGCMWVVYGLCTGCDGPGRGIFWSVLGEVIEISEIIINFVAADRISEARSRVMREGRRKRRLAANSRADGSAMT